MKSPEISHKAFTAWLAVSMFAPVAIISACSAWGAVFVTALLCSLLCTFVYRCYEDGVQKHLLYSVIAILWNVYALALAADWASMFWPGKGAAIAVPVVLLALAALSAYRGAGSASAVAATLSPICAVIFAVVLACGIGNIQWDSVVFSPAAPSGMLLFVFLLPVSAVAIPHRSGARIGVTLLGISVFAVVISVITTGTLSLPVAITRRDAFYEFSKSLKLFSAVERFEAIVAVGVTLSIYAMLSLLLSSINRMAENIHQGWGKWAVLCGGVAAGMIAVLQLWLGTKYVAVAGLLVWGILSVLSQGFPEKKRKKHEKTS